MLTGCSAGSGGWRVLLAWQSHRHGASQNLQLSLHR
jgi:hypothetical protein